MAGSHTSHNCSPFHSTDVWGVAHSRAYRHLLCAHCNPPTHQQPPSPPNMNECPPLHNTLQQAMVKRSSTHAPQLQCKATGWQRPPAPKLLRQQPTPICTAVSSMLPPHCTLALTPCLGCRDTASTSHPTLLRPHPNWTTCKVGRLNTNNEKPTHISPPRCP